MQSMLRSVVKPWKLDRTADDKNGTRCDVTSFSSHSVYITAVVRLSCHNIVLFLPRDAMLSNLPSTDARCLVKLEPHGTDTDTDTDDDIRDAPIV